MVFSFCWLVKKTTAANCRINTFICNLIAICSFVHVFIVYSIPAWNRAIYKPVTSLVARQPHERHPWTTWMLQNLTLVIWKGREKKCKKKIHEPASYRRGERQLPLCETSTVAMGVLYLPSQPGRSSLSDTWTGSPRRGRGRREARGVAKGLVMAG